VLAGLLLHLLFGCICYSDNTANIGVPLVTGSMDQKSKSFCTDVLFLLNLQGGWTLFCLEEFNFSAVNLKRT